MRWVSQTEKLVGHLSAITVKLSSLAEEGNWSQFLQLVPDRGRLISELNHLRERFNSLEFGRLPDQRKDQLNRRLRLEFENVAKVDQKIFDIINSEKKKLAGKLHQAYKGMSFLKQYKNRINSEKTIHRTI